MQKMVIFLSFFLAAGAACGQEAQPDRVTVTFSDPSRPKTLRASLLNGSITVSGYQGREAIIEARSEPGRGRARRREERSDGLRRIDVPGTGLAVEESDNVITVGTRSPNENANLAIQVPTD